MKINTASSFLKEDVIKKIEELRNAKYVFESTVKSKDGGWVNQPMAIFYTEKKHPEGSNYFALYMQHGVPYITDGITAIEPEYTGVVNDDEVVYSRYRHDYRSAGSHAIDGGRDYTRLTGSNPKTVKFKVVEDHLEIVE
jgi:hypothetical protein